MTTLAGPFVLVGCGKMGEAILGGLLNSGTVPGGDIVATTRRSGPV